MWSLIKTALDVASDLLTMFKRKPLPEPIPQPVNPDDVKKAKDLLNPKE
jgi:hypothetical protein